MLGKSEGRRRRGQRDVMVGWHHQLDGHEFEKALGLGLYPIVSSLVSSLHRGL